MVKTKTLSNTKEVHELGTFEMVSGVARISDPCYNRKTWCAGKIENILNGTWKAQVIKKCETYEYVGDVKDWAKGKTFNFNRNVLIAVHESFDKNSAYCKVKSDIQGGIDAGMAGIFDEQFYKKNYKEDYILVGREEYDQKQREYSQKTLQESHQLLAKINGYEYTPLTKEELTKDDLKYRLNWLESEIENLPKEIKEHSKRKGFEQFAKRDVIKLKEYRARVARYKADPKPENLIERTRDWYEICCDKSCSNIGAGVIRNGVVSSSGYGDGGYQTYIIYNSDGKVIGIKLQF